MNLNNINPRVLSRLEKMAQAEEAKFQAELSKEKHLLEQLKDAKHYATYGSIQNAETLVNIDGVTCLATTDGHSRISSIKVLDQEVYNEMNLQDKQAIKQYDNVLATRLEHNDYTIGEKSDKFYKVFSEAQGQPFDLIQERGRNIETEVPSSEVWSHFSSADHRQAGITKRAEALLDINSPQHLAGLSQQVMEQQAKVEYMIENADFPVSAEGGQGE